jgi:hypothetical protein
MKVWCPWCHRRVTLRKNGNLWQHNENTLETNGSLTPECPGSGRPPQAHPSRKRRGTGTSGT